MGQGTVSVLIVSIIIVMICIIGYFFYFFYSNHQNNKALKSDLHTLNERIIATNFTIKIDLNSKIYTLYSRKFDAPSISYNQQKFESLIVDEKGKQELKNWLNKLNNNDEDIEDLLITMRPFELEKESLFRFSIVNRDDENKIYFLKGSLVPKAKVSKINEDANIDAFTFRNRLKDLFEKKKYKTGTFLVVNFNRYDYVLKRYGDEGLQKYLASIWSSLSEFDEDDESAIAGIYRFDSFIMYYKGNRGRTEISRIVKKIYNEFGDYVGLEGFEIPVNPRIGYAYLGEFSMNLETVMRHAYNASNWAIANDILIAKYDSTINAYYQEENQIVSRILNAIREHSFHAVYQHILDFTRGRVIGTFATVNMHETEFKSMRKIARIAAANDIDKEFIHEIANMFVREYKPYSKFSGNTLFLICDCTMLEHIRNVFENEPELRNVKPVIVISDYDNLISNKEYIDLINEAYRDNIPLGIVAHEKMETTVNPILKKFRYTIWTKEMLADVLSDGRASVRFENVMEVGTHYNNTAIAYNVDSYDLAEFLRENGILLMSGPVLGLEDSNVRSNKIYSVRRLNKLLNKDYGD